MVVRKTTDTAMQKIKLSQICTDGGTQMRQNIDSDVVTAYADEIKNKARFLRSILFYDGEEYWLADGFHRFHGAHAAEKKHINANIHDGGKRDAVLFAVGANAAHGLRRTNADKRRAVTTLLEDKKWSNWSDRTIAKRCGVSNPFVSSVRNELLTVNSSQPVVIATEGEDGKIRKRSASEKRKTISDRSCAPDGNLSNICTTSDNRRDCASTPSGTSISAGNRWINSRTSSAVRCTPAELSRPHKP